MDAIIVALITSGFSFAGMVLTGYLSTKSAKDHNNKRQEQTENKLSKDISELKKDYTAIKVQLEKLSETDNCCSMLQKDVIDIKKENSLTFKALTACLDGLEQLGCNHSVSKTKQALEDWMCDQAHE